MTTDPDAYDSSDPRRPIRPLDPNFAEFLEPPVRPAPPRCMKCQRLFAPGQVVFAEVKGSILTGHVCADCAKHLHSRARRGGARAFSRARELAQKFLQIAIVFPLALIAVWIVAELRGPQQVDVRYPPRFLSGDATPGWHRVRALLGRDAVIEVDGRVGLVTVGDRPELRSQVAELLANDEAEVLVVDDPFDELRAILARQAP